MADWLSLFGVLRVACVYNRRVLFKEGSIDSTEVRVSQVTVWEIGVVRVFVGYEPQWYLKDPPAPPVPRVEDFGLVDVDPALLHVVPPPPAPPVEGNGDNEIIDLTSDTESEMTKHQW
ncbi:hypothetical protein CJ030_MR0G006958 [Morella rubra]|uniref:Uncharacterized protein n=1 Tax=Morella rubra TaxID=262757 RepID=A0A6A1UJ84_9ROSI|nr:hypothetical protein CJ030_MR0G006958 [Morella rubra]